MNFLEKCFVESPYLGAIVVIAVGTLVYLFFTIRRHARLRKKAIENISKYNELPLSVEVAYTNLLNKRYGYIQKYLIFLATSKISGFMGVLFSLFSLTASLYDASEKTAFWYGLISVICVIIALYLSPAKRIKEYIVLWRKCDAKVFEIESKLSSCNKLQDTNKYVKHIVKSITKFICEAESDLTMEEE